MEEENGLNTTYLNYLRTLQEIHEKKQHLQRCFSDGFLLMSKARYIMGVERVSKLHYSPNMEATTLAYVTDDESGNTVIDVLTEKQAANHNDSDKVRKRKSGADDSQVSEENLMENAVSDLKISDRVAENGTTDPLEWFGILVPRALRESQAKFKNATILIGQICTLNEKLKYYENIISESKSTIVIKQE